MGDVKNLVSDIKGQNLVSENLVSPVKKQNLVRPISRQTSRHPIYGRPKPPPSNAAVIVLAVIFWPVALAALVIGKSLGGTINR
jgi:hypothetical protein